MSYIKNLFIAIDQLANCILGGRPDETISAKVWRMKDRNKFYYFSRILIDKIFWFDENHCEESCKSELYRKQISSEYSKGKTK